MQAALLGFGGRIDRLCFGLCLLLLGIAGTVAGLTLALLLAPDDPIRASAALADPAGRLMRTVEWTMLPGVLWAGTSLMAMRLRDIGWRPGHILPAIAAAAVADSVIAMIFPRLTLAGGWFTPLGLAIALALVAALLFRPSAQTGDQNRRTIPA